jgi:hypothetical protein
MGSHFSNSLILRLREAVRILPVRTDELISPLQQRIPSVWFGVP